MKNRGAEHGYLLRELFPDEVSKGDLRRLAIVDSVIKIIARSGIDNTNFETVGKSLKMRPSHVAYYFSAKEEMVALAVQSITSNAQRMTVDLISKARNPEERLTAVVDGAFDWCEQYPDQCRVMLFFHYYATFKPAYKKLHTMIREAGANRLEAILEELYRGKVKHLNLRPQALAVQSLITGALINHLSCDMPETLNVVKSHTILGVRAIIGLSQ